ncbi:S-adenosyl-L-methionine-dependent methyltransferase superfamily protein [Hordeum vulgare]|nr:S-adenosyl-L-methionine-dependent methyltransferase superfamily protein [Hordeum vulgare]
MISERALELLALPNDGVPKMLIDIDVALEREMEGDLLLAEMAEIMSLSYAILLVTECYVLLIVRRYPWSSKPMKL